MGVCYIACSKVGLIEHKAYWNWIIFKLFMFSNFKVRSIDAIDLVKVLFYLSLDNFCCPYKTVLILK